MNSRLNCVMLIDDDEPTNFFNEMILASSGCAHHIKTVQSGREALDYLQAAEFTASSAETPVPDLIFLDINMPAMNGWEFLEQYRTLDKEKRRGIIVVMLTTSLFPEDAAKASQLPEVVGFENKPLTHEKLERILRKYFDY
jgi:CheY-like chemotaxis protein